MRRTVLPGLVATLLLGACAPTQTNLVAPSASSSAPSTSAPSTVASGGEAIVIRANLVIAATAGSEPIATGGIVEGSTLAGGPFCARGTIRDSHASLDPAVEHLGLIDRT